ncbi:MAG: ZIP family metal transporter [Candidatus Sericytochromatia bacterium]|jgi:zinc transporter ZupT|nr:ZIP family metal transporter [Candidatus Sericytochromatia bacterium]
MVTDNTLVVGLFTASTTMAGGMWLASRPRRWLTHARLAAIMALGAGLLLAVLFFELLPAALNSGNPAALSWLFGGVLAVLLFERYLAPHLNFIGRESGPTTCEHASACHDHDQDTHGAHLLSHGAACSALGCLLVCTFFDGVAMAAGFALEFHVGLLVMIGLLAHILPEGMLAAAVVLAAGSSHQLARRAALATGLAFLLGLALPLALGGATGTLAYALPLAAGVLLYVVLAQLIPVTLRTPTGVPLVVTGAMLFGVVERLMPHTH